MQRNLTRKDFNLIAETIRQLPSFQIADYGKLGHPLEVCYFDAIVARFAQALATTNPRFNEERFIAACHGRQTARAGKAA